MNRCCRHFVPVAVLLAACGRPAAVDHRMLEVLAPALVTAPGDDATDQRIRQAQASVRTRADVANLEQLASAFLGKARRSGDAGCYKLAERCADAIAIVAPGDATALLLRGHVLHALHRFHDAEELGRQAVQQRGSFLDHGLLGDALLDQGRLQQALDCYNTMLALRPCLQGFVRTAQVRFLRGDLHGARELLELGRGAGSRRDPESLAWVQARLGAIALQTGDSAQALADADAALALVPDYPAALLLRGRTLLARGENEAASTALVAAAGLCPLPEYLWAAAEALQAAGRRDEAVAAEARLRASGAVEDPRTYAQFLLSRNEEPAQALALLQGELRERSDVFTQAAHALALVRTGDPAGARVAVAAALAEGTREPRLLWQAGAALLATGDRARAAAVLATAAAQAPALLPSEQRELAALRATL